MKEAAPGSSTQSSLQEDNTGTSLQSGISFPTRNDNGDSVRHGVDLAQEQEQQEMNGHDHGGHLVAVDETQRHGDNGNDDEYNPNQQDVVVAAGGGGGGYHDQMSFVGDSTISSKMTNGSSAMLLNKNNYVFGNVNLRLTKMNTKEIFGRSDQLNDLKTSLPTQCGLEEGHQGNQETKRRRS